MAMPSTGG